MKCSIMVYIMLRLSGSSLFAEVPFIGFPVFKRLKTLYIMYVSIYFIYIHLGVSNIQSVKISVYYVCINALYLNNFRGFQYTKG